MNDEVKDSLNEDDIFEVVISINDVAIDKNEIGLSLGYTEGNIPEHFSELIDEITSQIPQYCDIRAGYRLVDVERSPERNDGLLIGNKFFKLDKIVTGQLKKSEKAALFICTIGPGLETRSKQLLNSGDIMLSYLVDIAASVTAESVTNILHDKIKAQMQKSGLNVTNRYSPGYCNWSVSEQHLLFSFFPENFCEVSLTESALMIPIKSVSGIIGVGHEVKWKDYICDRCGIKDCTYRAVRLKSTDENKGKAKIILDIKK